MQVCACVLCLCSFIKKELVPWCDVLYLSNDLYRSHCMYCGRAAAVRRVNQDAGWRYRLLGNDAAQSWAEKQEFTVPGPCTRSMCWRCTQMAWICVLPTLLLPEARPRATGLSEWHCSPLSTFGFCLFMAFLALQLLPSIFIQVPLWATVLVLTLSAFFKSTKYVYDQLD